MKKIIALIAVAIMALMGTCALSEDVKGAFEDVQCPQNRFPSHAMYPLPYSSTHMFTSCAVVKVT